MNTWTIAVGFTTKRPVRPDQHTHTVTFVDPEGTMSPSAAECFAAQWVGSRPGVTMVTRTTIIAAVL